MGDDVSVKIKMLDVRAKMPEQSTAGAAGFDVFAINGDEVLPGEARKIVLGFALEIPPGYAMEMLPRSGLALNKGITIANSPGLIDCDYRGEVAALIRNLGASIFVISPGMKIAQVKFVEVPKIVFQTVTELSETARGAGGFGHTGS